jgi:uncharacterized protein YndB with AHSA1/START domain
MSPGWRQWSCFCSGNRMMTQNPTRLTPSFPEGNHAARRGVSKQPMSDRWTVLLEFSIRADARRLFHALTVPEYIETWLSFPGHHGNCANLARTAEHDYAIEHRCEGKASVTIAGTYSVRQRHNLMFSWRVDGDPSVPESSVDIRLRGNFESTTLMLRHKGFESAMQCAWHRALWTASIERLVRLYDSTAFGSEPSQPRSRYRLAKSLA